MKMVQPYINNILNVSNIIQQDKKEKDYLRDIVPSQNSRILCAFYGDSSCRSVVLPSKSGVLKRA